MSEKERAGSIDCNQGILLFLNYRNLFCSRWLDLPQNKMAPGNCNLLSFPNHKEDMILLNQSNIFKMWAKAVY